MLALNAENEIETSALEGAKLARMAAQAFRATVVDGAFLIAFDQSADYESANFEWFRARYPKFAYVDRVIVARSARRRGLARALYEDVFEAARAGGLPLVGCEVNVAPPNPASDAFHASLGFTTVGVGTLESGARVGYLARAIAQ